MGCCELVMQGSEFEFLFRQIRGGVEDGKMCASATTWWWS
ncbi:hypothetical protein LINPERPRIM_LOCUS28251 [Linum perenne]